MMDFDCMGAALGLSALTKVYDKPCGIVVDLDDTEAKLRESIEKNDEDFTRKHRFITPSMALDEVEDDTLLVMVDHHNREQTQVPELIDQVEDIVVIDHHRRTGEFTFKKN